MWVDALAVQQSRDQLNQLLALHNMPACSVSVNHHRAEFSGTRMRWQLHTEFISWTFIQPVEATSASFDSTHALPLPSDFLSLLAGQRLSHIQLIAQEDVDPQLPSPLVSELDERLVVGSHVANEAARVFTDFNLRPEGDMRMVILAHSLSPRRLGRLVQQLLEIETYRMMALLGLPAARTMSIALTHAEKELAELAEAIRSAQTHDEAALLDRLTRLAGEVEQQYAATHSRFAATRAYFDLIDQRLRELQESALVGLQTLGEFIDRRLSPARKTCDSASQRQDALSVRVSRISNLLRTRVDFEQQQSSQDLLKTMDARQDVQVRLQTTVEGLSVAAITYYITGLIGYVVKGAHSLGWSFSTEATIACTVPVIALVVWWFIHRLHHHLLSPVTTSNTAEKK
jgi:uncharacterized membrane-anchored protein